MWSLKVKRPRSLDTFISNLVNISKLYNFRKTFDISIIKAGLRMFLHIYLFIVAVFVVFNDW